MKSTLLKQISVFAFSLLALVASSTAAEKPEVIFERTLNELLDVLSETNTGVSIEERRERVLNVFQKSNFEFDTIIRRTLGRNWNNLSEEQQVTIKNLITTMLLRAYTREFADSERPVMKFGETKFLNPKETKLEIASTIEVRGADVNLAYRMVNLPNVGWQIYDIIVEGVSMVSNYRKQFDDHFQTNKTGEDLINLLKEKLAN